MLNFSLLAAEIVSLVWGTPANFNGFRILASLLQRRRSTEANQTLHNVWPLPGLVDYVYIFGGCCSVTEFCQVQNSLCVRQFLRSPIGSVTAGQSSSGGEPNFAALSAGRHLFGRATITLGIGPHFSFVYFLPSPVCRVALFVSLVYASELQTYFVTAALCNRAGHYIFVL